MEVANWIRKNGCNSHRSFWRRFRFSFRAYSFLQQLRLMRRKRCSRPSLKESTSGRCNYDLACYFSFLSHFYFFPSLSLSPFLFFRFSLPFSHSSNEGRGQGCSTKMGKCLSERDNETRDKTLSLLHPNSLSLSLSLLERFLSVLVGGGEVKLFDVRTTVFLLLSRSVSFHVDDFGDEFCRVFEFSNVVLRSRARYFEYVLAIQATRGKI